MEIDSTGIETREARARTTRRIDEIIVGKRFRRDMGDLAGDAQSIADIGLMQPVTICSDGTLVDGERRIRICRDMLGWIEIPVHVVDLDQVERGEYAANVHRKPFTLSEMVTIKRALEPKLKAQARERQIAGRRPSGNLPQAGRAADYVARYVGKARRTIDKAEAIVKAAEDEPETFGRIRDAMDRTGRVDAPFRRLKALRQSIAIRAEPPPLPSRGPYRVAVIDPPWPFDAQAVEAQNSRAVRPYPTMTIEQICALAVASLMDDNSIIWLWCDNYHLINGDALRVLGAWGFEPKTLLTWAKDKTGLGFWLRGRTEHCVFATRGKPTVVLTDESTLLHAPLGAHSEKPDAFYALVEKLCPAARYAELFARRARANWDAHGDEAPGANGGTS